MCVRVCVRACACLFVCVPTNLASVTCYLMNRCGTSICSVRLKGPADLSASRVFRKPSLTLLGMSSSRKSRNAGHKHVWCTELEGLGHCLPPTHGDAEPTGLRVGVCVCVCVRIYDALMSFRRRRNHPTARRTWCARVSGRSPPEAGNDAQECM